MHASAATCVDPLCCRFLRTESEKEAAGDDAWAQRMAMNYEKRLFKEFAICDLSRYKTGQVQQPLCARRHLTPPPPPRPSHPRTTLDTGVWLPLLRDTAYETYWLN